MMNSPKEIAENYVGIGISKTKLSIPKMLALSILAGMFIAFGGIASTTVATSIEAASVGKLAGAAIFPAGLAMVLIAGSELFTGNCLLVVPLLEKKVRLGAVLRNWFFVYLGNFLGGILVAALVVFSHLGGQFGGALGQAIVNTAVNKVTLSFGDALLRGILCNVLVCLAVWMSFAAKSVGGKIIGLYLPIVVFVLCSFEHSVANMYFITAGMFASSVHGIEAAGLGLGTMFINNLLPVTIGNIIGGAGVGAAYWFVYLKKD